MNYLHLHSLLYYCAIFRFVSTQTLQCYDQVHLGPQEDGGWEVCIYGPFRIESPCLIYSFGSVIYILFHVKFQCVTYYFLKHYPHFSMSFCFAVC